MFFKPLLLFVLSVVLFLIPGTGDASLSSGMQGQGSGHENADLKIQECRIALDEVKKIRSDPTFLTSNGDVVDGLVLTAEKLLKKIDQDLSEQDLTYLLGKCQGILDSLTLVLNAGKYRSSYKEFPDSYRMRPEDPVQSTQQSAAYVNHRLREPLPPLTPEEEAEIAHHYQETRAQKNKNTEEKEDEIIQASSEKSQYRAPLRMEENTDIHEDS